MDEHQNSISNDFQALENEEEDLLVSQLNMDVKNQYVVFTIGDEEYGLQILTVQEIISLPTVTRIPGMPDHIPGIINLRGDIVPLYILRNKFQQDDTEITDQNVVIIVQTEIGKKKTVGFIVDSVADVISITEDDVSETPDFQGALDVKFVEKIGNVQGRMIMIIGVNDLVSEKEKNIIENLSSKEI